MEEFPYENRKDDINLVGSRKEKALKEDTFEIKTSYIQTRIFEALLGTIMELHWLPEAFLSETSDYDDWINGADAVLEAGPFKIMIDFTCQKDKKRLHKKIEGINARIERGELGKLKYFKSQVDKRKHALIMLPIVIIALSATTMRELLDLYLTGKKKELENHWARSAIAEEIIAQVGAFKRHINNPTRTGYDPEKARFMTLSYNRLEKVIIKMANIKLPQAEETKKQPESQRPDSVYQALMAAVAEG